MLHKGYDFCSLGGKAKISHLARRKNMYIFLSMLVPAVILLAVFNYLPMAGIVIAFQRFVPAKGLFSPNQKWVGLQNIERAFKDPFFVQAVQNTLFISIAKIVLNILVAILIAILINELRKNKLKRIVQTAVYLPHFISWVILGSVMKDLLSSDGLINIFISSLFGKTVPFMTDNGIFPWVLIITDVWKEFGFNTIVYLAAITAVDQTLYEAAIVDGANKLQQILHITLPGMATIIVLMALLNIGNIFNANFDQVFNMYSPQVYKSGDVIDTLIYRKGILDANYSLSTAIGLFKGLISCMLISVSYYLAYRFADYKVF